MVEPRTVNALVVGSIPTFSAKLWSLMGERETGAEYLLGRSFGVDRLTTHARYGQASNNLAIVAHFVGLLHLRCVGFFAGRLIGRTRDFESLNARFESSPAIQSSKGVQVGNQAPSTRATRPAQTRGTFEVGRHIPIPNTQDV